MVVFPKEINVSAFARSIGMNESLLRKYTSGITKPSERQLKRIEKAIHELGSRLKKVKLYYSKTCHSPMEDFETLY